MDTCTNDASRLSAAMEKAAHQVDELARLAREEQERREKAREWKRERDNEGFLDQVGDFFGSGGLAAARRVRGPPIDSVTAVMLRFDEPRPIARLSGAPRHGRMLFAASMAGRLLPLYDTYGKSAGRGHPAVLREGLDPAWDATDRDGTRTPSRTASPAAIEVARRPGDAAGLRRSAHAAGLRLADLMRF
jgi:hypothetical protein